MANTRVGALKELVNKLSNETGKKWPNLNNAVLASGTNGIVIRTRNDPNKLVKVTSGNVMREPQAMRNLRNSGFVPKLNDNFVHLTKLNNNMKKTLFPLANTNNATAFVMERVGNSTLWQYVKKGHNTNNNKRQIRTAVRRAIAFMHARGISHGDLHSGNILVELGPDGKMKKIWVIDFGRAVRFPPGTSENNAYNKLHAPRLHKNYNLFNSSRNPRTTLYTYTSNGAGNGMRKNRELYVKMYGGNEANFKRHPSPRRNSRAPPSAAEAANLRRRMARLSARGPSLMNAVRSAFRRSPRK
jgi:serine/threonine protein kinase